MIIITNHYSFIYRLTAGIDKQSYLAMKNAKYGTKMSKEDREKMVLQKLASFTSALRKASANSSGESKDEDQDDKSWMTHTLVFEKPKEAREMTNDLAQCHCKTNHYYRHRRRQTMD